MIAGLILAAGESSRMGRDKALLIYRGRTFVESVIGTLRDAEVERIIVVLGHHAEEVQRAVDLAGVEVLLNTDYHCGQTSSLQKGLRVLASEALEGVLLCPVDHPAVSVETMRRLVAAFHASGAPVIIPTYQGQRGHPPLIGRALFAELLALSSDQGANTVIRKYRNTAQLLEVNDPGILTDVDDLNSYQRLR